MSSELTIGAVSKQTGLTSKTIRFYEDEGLVPAPRRGVSGYRLYSEADVMRLRLVSRARLLGLDLATIRNLVTKAFSTDCATFSDELHAVISSQRAEVESRLQELMALRDELSGLESHIEHCCEGCDPVTMAAECSYCGLIEPQDEDNVSKPREGR
jgi:MerR family transcriptional regulator, copper efflux regulator